MPIRFVVLANDVVKHLPRGSSDQLHLIAAGRFMEVREPATCAVSLLIQAGHGHGYGDTMGERHGFAR